MNEQDDDMTNGPVNPGPQDQLPDETELRALAIHNLRRREAFKTHLVVYLLVNAVFVGTWVMAGVVSGIGQGTVQATPLLMALKPMVPVAKPGAP